MPYTPKPGDIGLSYSRSFIGKMVRVAQSLVGDWAVYSHAFIVLEDGYILEALPKGAKINRLDKYDLETTAFSRFGLTDEQRNKICTEARKLEGTPYSWLDFLAIGIKHYCKLDHSLFRWIDRRVRDSGKMICSQLVAESYKRAGLDLDPTDGPQYLTPGDLSQIIMLDYGKIF